MPYRHLPPDFRTLMAASVAIAITAASLPTTVAVAARPGDQEESANILIADQFNNRVIEIDHNHKIVWQFGDGSDKPGATSVVGTNDAERFGPYTLISGTGTPPGFPGCSDTVNGCPDNRVFIVDHAGKIVWQYGQAGVAGSGANQINTPVQAAFLTSFPGHPGFHVIITDQANERIILVELFSHQIVWQYGTTGVTGNGPNQLNNPNSAEVLGNGHVLIADENNNRVIEINASGAILHQFTAGGTVSGAAFASRLANGDTLITDSNNNRILIVTRDKKVVFDYATNTRPGSMTMPLPTRAVMLRNGNILISDQFNDQVIEINQHQQIVFSQGQIQVDGNGFNQLNAPYDAKVIGDYTGLTPPFGFGD
jgi:outer membrane protein assembly factor BamB